MRRNTWAAPFAIAAVAVALAACGGGDEADLAGEEPITEGPVADAPTSEDIGGEPPAAGGATEPAAGVPTLPASAPEGLTQEMVAQGSETFVTVCARCHGQDATGTPLAPDLTDADWINIDGSYDAIVTLVNTGVPQPVQHPTPMPPMGGADLSEAQVKAVAAYVYAISHSS